MLDRTGVPQPIPFETITKDNFAQKIPALSKINGLPAGSLDLVLTRGDSTVVIEALNTAYQLHLLKVNIAAALREIVYYTNSYWGNFGGKEKYIKTFNEAFAGIGRVEPDGKLVWDCPHEEFINRMSTQSLAEIQKQISAVTGVLTRDGETMINAYVRNFLEENANNRRSPAGGSTVPFLSLDGYNIQLTKLAYDMEGVHGYAVRLLKNLANSSATAPAPKLVAEPAAEPAKSAPKSSRIIIWGCKKAQDQGTEAEEKLLETPRPR